MISLKCSLCEVYPNNCDKCKISGIDYEIIRDKCFYCRMCGQVYFDEEDNQK